MFFMCPLSPSECFGSGSALWNSFWILIRMEDADPDLGGKNRKKFAKNALKPSLTKLYLPAYQFNCFLKISIKKVW